MEIRLACSNRALMKRATLFKPFKPLHAALVRRQAGTLQQHYPNPTGRAVIWSPSGKAPENRFDGASFEVPFDAAVKCLTIDRQCFAGDLYGAINISFGV